MHISAYVNQKNHETQASKMLKIDECGTKGFPRTKIIKINAPWSPFVVVTHTIHLSQEKSLKSCKIDGV